MGELAEYEVTQNGVTSTMQLTEEDAKRLGGKKIAPAAAPADEDDTPAPAAPEVPTRGAAAVPNRARRN